MDKSLRQMCLIEIDKQYNKCIGKERSDKNNLVDKAFREYDDDNYMIIPSKEAQEKYQMEKNEITIRYNHACLKCIDQMAENVQDLDTNFRGNELEFLKKIRSEEFM